MTDTSTTTQRPAWSVDLFEAFWSNPDPALVGPVLADDVVGHWAGLDEPVRGREDYVRCIAAIVEALPGMRLEVAESAQAGQYTFVRWIMHATGAHGPFTFSGVDRIATRDGLVTENVIVFDTRAFEARSGIAVPWAVPEPR